MDNVKRCALSGRTGKRFVGGHFKRGLSFTQFHFKSSESYLPKDQEWAMETVKDFLAAVPCARSWKIKTRNNQTQRKVGAASVGDRSVLCSDIKVKLSAFLRF